MHPYLNLGDIEIKTFPIIIVMAFFCCINVFLVSEKYDSYYFSQVRSSFLYSMVASLIFGKLFYFLTRINDSNISITERLSGFVFYGGLIGSAIGLYIYSKTKWNRYFDLLDVYLSILPLGQAIGRIGCYLNGCCYGKRYIGIMSTRYIIEGIEIQVFPTWFVESLFCFILFLCMFYISKEINSGTYSAIYMVFYSLFRFFIEFYRGDSLRGIWYGVSFSQYISIIVFLMGIVIYMKSKHLRDRNLIINSRRG